MRGNHRLALAAMLAFAAMGATHAQDATLYARIGGDAAITRISDELIERSRLDAKTSRSFEKVNIKRLKAKIVEQLCAASGGPCVYTGDDMKTSHAGLDITEAEFYGMVEHLVAILDDMKVGTREKNELLKILAPMKRDVVTR